ncbi:MAG: GNAT family N-acetyltransferase [Candidatus Izemoplasmatales bacterium]
MIIEVNKRKELKKFVYFIKDLYKDDSHYVYPLFYIFYRELKKQVLVDKKYKAILSQVDGKILGRLLYTFEFNSKLNKKVCYFSYLDCFDNQEVFNELFIHMEEDMKENDVFYIEGSFTPYDPDNRRGILIKGFDDDPTIFTSYNYPYYENLFENYGFKKIHDTFSLQPVFSIENYKKLEILCKMFERRFQIEVSPIDFKQIDKEIADIHDILVQATTEIIYQEAPSIELIKAVAKKMKFLLRPEIVLIARERNTKKPIGFVICLLDYNQIFKLTKGKIKILKFIKPLKYVNRSRGMMQYVIPKYQNSGLIGYMYNEIYKNFKKMGITKFEAGTIMEENFRSISVWDKFGGEVTKIYRIYGKEIQR